jgi:hypothetical protein
VLALFIYVPHVRQQHLNFSLLNIVHTCRCHCSRSRVPEHYAIQAL